MPYKNPEDKRRWEREHRQERNARRIKQERQELATGAERIPRKPTPDPIATKKTKGGWKVLLGGAVALVVMFLGLPGVGLPPPYDSRGHGSGNSGM